MLVGIIIGAVVLLLIIFVISSYNKLVKQKVNVEEAFDTKSGRNCKSLCKT